MNGRMEGRVALVTGSTSGIGKEVARRYALEGASVVITGRRSERGERIAEEIGSEGGECSYLRADLARPDEAYKLVDDTVDRYGSLDTLVNNAGDPGSARGDDGPLERTDVEYWDRAYETNVRSALCVTKRALPHLRSSGHGRIIHVSSIMAVRGMGWDTYAWSKAALIGLGRSLAFSYAADQITSNVLVVGSVVVERTAESWETEASRRFWSMNGLTRLGRPEDIANGCLYLGSDEGGYVTGSVVTVDGGMDARGLAFPSDSSLD